MTLCAAEHDQSVAYIDDDDDDDPTIPVYLTTPYVCGRVLLSSVLDSLVTTVRAASLFPYPTSKSRMS